MKKILFVEDDPTLGFVIKDHLQLSGYEVHWAKDGTSAYMLFQQELIDLCILDVMLPKLNGFELAKQIREQNSHVPILFLTAKSLQEDRLHALRIGADDYLTKPFSIEELVFKVKIFLKRSVIQEETQSKDTFFKLASYQFDAQNLTLFAPSGATYTLTERECELLLLFCKHKEQVLKREFILQQLWQDDDYFSGRSLDVFISRLRKYLKEDDDIKIENIPRVGFRLKG